MSERVTFLIRVPDRANLRETLKLVSLREGKPLSELTYEALWHLVGRLEAKKAVDRIMEKGYE